MSVLTENQYTVLRRYEHGHRSWQEGNNSATHRRLRAQAYLRRAGDDMDQITPSGTQALVAFREKYGIPEEVPA